MWPSLRRALLFVVCLVLAPAGIAGQAPVFDVHIHYSHDVWDKIPPERAIAKLREAGITRAMVSSSSDKGTQMLYEAAPDLIVPALRPYRERGTLDTWMYDDSVIPYLKDRLTRYDYAAIGEFHVNGEEADLPVVRQMVQLAKRHDLILHAHADADAIVRLFDQYPQARIIWAHAGFEYAPQVKALLERYPRLWADLSFRWEIHNEGRFLKQWRELLVDHADRFLAGVDTYTPQRWLQIGQTLAWYESLFRHLPADVARKIRYDNAERLISRHYELAEPD